MDVGTQEKWTEVQMKYISFLARGCRTKSGEHRTEEQFAKDMGVNPSTLWRWKQIPGFKLAVVEESLGKHVKDIPTLVEGQVAVAKGQSEIKAQVKDKYGKVKTVTYKPNTPAFNAIMKLMGATDKVESTVDATVNANVTHHLGGKSDEELDAIIKGATGVN